jgi:hypothetical protein
MSFVHAGLQLCFALIVPTTALTVAGLFGQALSGRFAPTFGVLPLLRLDLIFVPLLLLVATASRLRSIAVRLPALIVLATVGCVLAVSRSWWDALVVTWPGILAIALSTVAATLLLRWQIRLHFCNCDLIAEAAEGRPFVATATFSFNFKRPSAPAAS